MSDPGSKTNLERSTHRVSVRDGAKPEDPPTLDGYNYSNEQAYRAREHGELLSMRTELTHICNFKCIYCNEGEVRPQEDSISTDTIKNVIGQVKSLGGKSVVIIGGGEPTLYRDFTEIVRFVSNNGMVPVIFTNGSTMNREMATFLHDNNASVILKMDSLKEHVQDELAGKKGAFRDIQNALNRLVGEGFTANRSDHNLKLGLAFVSTALNVEELPDIWRLCRANNLYPNHELLVPRGRAQSVRPRLELKKAQVKQLKEELLRLDRTEFGYDWLPYKPLSGSGCLQVFYSIYLTTRGFVRPCADISIELFNVNQLTVREVTESDFFKLVRYADHYLQGKCQSCEFHAECIGCRGIAYSTYMVDHDDPYQAVISEDPLCWR